MCPVTKRVQCIVGYNRDSSKGRYDTGREIFFFEFKVSLNFINQEGKDISVCPSCGCFCQRQKKKKHSTKEMHRMYKEEWKLF